MKIVEKHVYSDVHFPLITFVQGKIAILSTAEIFDG